MAIEDEIVAVTITAILVPIKTTLKNLSGFRVNSQIIKAFLFPFFAKYLRRNLLADITAVSIPEKNAAKNKLINNIIVLILVHHSVKIVLPPVYKPFIFLRFCIFFNYLYLLNSIFHDLLYNYLQLLILYLFTFFGYSAH